MVFMLIRMNFDLCAKRDSGGIKPVSWENQTTSPLVATGVWSVPPLVLPTILFPSQWK